jgi:hypothetical protein
MTAIRFPALVPSVSKNLRPLARFSRTFTAFAPATGQEKEDYADSADQNAGGFSRLAVKWRGAVIRHRINAEPHLRVENSRIEKLGIVLRPQENKRSSQTSKNRNYSRSD